MEKIIKLRASYVLPFGVILQSGKYISLQYNGMTLTVYYMLYYY